MWLLSSILYQLHLDIIFLELDHLQRVFYCHLSCAIFSRWIKSNGADIKRGKGDKERNIGWVFFNGNTFYREIMLHEIYVTCVKANSWMFFVTATCIGARFFFSYPCCWLSPIFIANLGAISVSFLIQNWLPAHQNKGMWFNFNIRKDVMERDNNKYVI